MHLWNTEKLIEKFGKNAISEREKFRYFIFILLAFAVAMEMPLWFPSEEPYGGFDLALFLILIAATIFGNAIVFKANKDGSDFFARVMCLSVPIGIKMMLALILILLAVFSAFGYMGWIAEEGYSAQERFAFVLLPVLFDIAYYFLLYKSIKRVNEIIQAQKVPGSL